MVETITTRARASATGAVEMTVVARTVFVAVCAEVDEQIDDEPTRQAIKRAYFDRLLRSDLSGPVLTAVEGRDPATNRLFEALTAFLDVVPRSIVASSDLLPTQLLRPPAVHWGTLLPSARQSYWRMVRHALRADPRMSRRIAWRRAVEPAFVFARVGPPIGPAAASAVLSIAALARRVLGRSARR
jgi:hypothetical protein